MCSSVNLFSFLVTYCGTINWYRYIKVFVHRFDIFIFNSFYLHYHSFYCSPKSLVQKYHYSMSHCCPYKYSQVFLIKLISISIKQIRNTLPHDIYLNSHYNLSTLIAQKHPPKIHKTNTQKHKGQIREDPDRI